MFFLYFWKRRRDIYEKYCDGLQGIHGVDFPRLVENSKRAYHLFTIWVDQDKRNNILKQLGGSGIGVAVNFRNIHLLIFFVQKFAWKRRILPVAEKIVNSTISLPFYPKLSEPEIKHVAQTFKKIIT